MARKPKPWRSIDYRGFTVTIRADYGGPVRSLANAGCVTSLRREESGTSRENSEERESQFAEVSRCRTGEKENGEREREKESTNS